MHARADSKSQHQNAVKKWSGEEHVVKVTVNMDCVPNDMVERISCQEEPVKDI